MEKKRKRMTLKQANAQLGIEQRRARVAKLRVMGHSMRAIAAKEKVSVATVHEDLTTVMERTRSTSAAYIERERAVSVERMDSAVKALMPKVVKGGDEEAIRTLVHVENRRAKLEGLDAPTRQEFGGIDGAPIAVEATVKRVFYYPKNGRDPEVEQAQADVAAETAEPADPEAEGEG